MKYILIILAIVNIYSATVDKNESSTTITPDDEMETSGNETDTGSNGNQTKKEKKFKYLSAVPGAAITAGKIAYSFSGVETKCEPPLINTTDLQKILPPAMADMVTGKNIQTLHQTARLATLAASASGGDPMAVIMLLFFLASPESPVGGWIDIGKQIIPHLDPKDVVYNIETVKKNFNGFNEEIGSIMPNKKGEISQDTKEKFANAAKDTFTKIKSEAPNPMSKFDSGGAAPFPKFKSNSPFGF